MALLAAERPDLRVHVLFLPQFQVGAQEALLGLCLFDTLCLLSGAMIFDHLVR
jgi:hypothetical protein